MAGVNAEQAARFAYLAEGNAKQARKRVAVAALLRDEHDRVLLVDPTYKEDWDLPGGMVEANEPPRAALARELREELGLILKPSRLLLIEWVPPHGPWDDQLAIIFDGGTLDADTVATLQITDAELRAFAFLSLTEARQRLRPYVAQRLERARHALSADLVNYSERETW